MKKTVMPTKFEHIGFVYLMGTGKILLITAASTVLCFLALAALLSFTGFSEGNMKTGVLICSALCLILGNILGYIWHKRSFLKSSYAFEEKRIKLYLMSDCLYSCIIYFIVVTLL